MLRNDFSQVLLVPFVLPVHHAIRLWVQGYDECLAHSQALQNSLHKVLLGSYGPGRCVALTVLRSGGS